MMTVCASRVVGSLGRLTRHSSDPGIGDTVFHRDAAAETQAGAPDSASDFHIHYCRVVHNHIRPSPAPSRACVLPACVPACVHAT